MRFLVCALFCLLLLPAAAQDGWKDFQQNRWTEARQAFEQAGEDRGLAWLAEQEGDDVQAARAWSRFLLAHPDDPTASSVWGLFVEAASSSAQSELLTSTGRALAENSAALPELRASARSQLAEQAGSESAAALGYVSNWKILGPFDNVSRSGLDKVLPPEQGLSFLQTVPGRDRRMIGWHDLPATHVGFVAPPQYLGQERGEVYYAATAVSGFSGKAWLRLDPSGACQVWLNGERVFYSSSYGSSSPAQADVFTIPVELKSGWNTLLVKLASEEDSYEADFRLRFTAPDSDVSLPLECVTTQAAPEAVKPQPPATVPMVSTRLARLQGSVAPDADLLRARNLLQLGRAAETVALLKEALTRQPDNGVLHWWLSWALASDGHSDEARLERDRARKLAPRLLSAEVSYQNDQISQGKTESALASLRKLAAQAPTNLEVRGALYLTYLQSDLTQDALREMLDLLKVAPTASNYELAIQLLQLSDRGQEAQSLLNEGLSRYPHEEELLSLRASATADRGDLPGALAQYQELARSFPESDYSDELAKLYRQSGDWKNVAASLERGRRYRPNNAEVVSDLGDAYRELGQQDKARQAYEEALRLDPGLADVREKLALVSGDKPVLELVSDTDVQPLLAAGATQEQYPDAPAVVLLDQGRVVLYPDMACLRSYHELIKVFDEGGAQRFARIGMFYNLRSSRPKLEVARIYKPDGTIQDVRDQASRGRINFPSLSAGDVLEYAYSVQDAPSGSLANHFWEEWFISTEVPVRLSRYVLVAPQNLTRLKIQPHGPGMPEPRVTRQGDWEIREWVLQEVARVQDHPLAAPARDVGDWLEMSTIGDWSEIADWYVDLSGPRCQPDEALRQKALELTRAAHTPEEKLRALQAYVARDIRYQTTPFRNSAYVPTDGKKVLEDRYGDCKDKSALLCAMLKAVGLNGKMVLLATRDEGLSPRLPAPYFNHAITLVELPGKTVWVDPTSDYQELTVLPIDDQGVGALVVTPGARALIPVPVSPADQHLVSMATHSRLAPDGNLQGTIECSYQGQFGYRLRAALLQLDKPARDKAMQGVVRRFLTERASSTRTQAVNLENPDKPVVLKMDFKANGYANNAGGFLLVKAPFAYDSDSLAHLSQLLEQAGAQDLELSGARSLRKITMSLELPKGMQAELPKPTSQKLPFASYKVSFANKGAQVTGLGELRVETMRVTPAEARALAGLLENFTRDLSQPLLVRKK